MKHHHVCVSFLTDVCPFGHVNSSRVVSFIPIPNSFECVSLIRLHGAAAVVMNFTFFNMETGHDGLWLYPGFVADNYNFPAFDKSPNQTYYTESNFWLQIFTDKNILSPGFTFEISTGK